MLTFDEARSRLVSFASVLSGERVSLDVADGRVLGEDIRSATDLPRFDYSAMDGYAIAVGGLGSERIVELPVRGEMPAGGSPDATLAPGTAMRIFTGAPIPRCADAVIMQENVERTGDDIRFERVPAAGENVRRRGEDLRSGAVAIARGTRLQPGHIALAASLDRPTLLVARRPVVTIVASGDELRAPGAADRPGSIPESNGYFVAALARRVGAIARLGAFVPDDRASASLAIANALEATDVLVTIGGVSVGDHDVIRPALEAAGVTIEFYRVAMKPGKPLTVGRRGSTIVLGLPGNPASASLTFTLFGVPVLRALQGDHQPFEPCVPVKVRGGLERKPGRREFLRARSTNESGAFVAELARNQASGAVTSFAGADALVVVPEDRTSVADGDVLEAILLDH